MKGAYVLIIEIEERVSISLNSLGKIEFKPGTWVYVGSAMGQGSTSIENRLKRHFRSEKAIYWHIDHLLEKKVILSKAFWSESHTHVECDIAHAFEVGGLFEVGPKRFGSSDCKSGCATHIFRYSELTNSAIENIIESIFNKLGLSPSMTINGEIL
jgi:Uri superfamily endonuclease